MTIPPKRFSELLDAYTSVKNERVSLETSCNKFLCDVASRLANDWGTENRMQVLLNSDRGWHPVRLRDVMPSAARLVALNEECAAVLSFQVELDRGVPSTGEGSFAVKFELATTRTTASDPHFVLTAKVGDAKKTVTVRDVAADELSALGDFIMDRMIPRVREKLLPGRKNAV